MKVLFRNVLAFLVGITIFFICDLVVAPILYLIAQIPILGKIIFFLGTEPEQIIANYAIWTTSFFTLITARAIALPNKTGHKYAMIFLAIVLAPLYCLQAYSIFLVYGFSLDLITYIVAAIVSVVWGFAMGLGKE